LENEEKRKEANNFCVELCGMSLKFSYCAELPDFHSVSSEEYWEALCKNLNGFGFDLPFSPSHFTELEMLRRPLRKGSFKKFFSSSDWLSEDKLAELINFTHDERMWVIFRSKIQLLVCFLIKAASRKEEEPYAVRELVVLGTLVANGLLRNPGVPFEAVQMVAMESHCIPSLVGKAPFSIRDSSARKKYSIGKDVDPLAPQNLIFHNGNKFSSLSVQLLTFIQRCRTWKGSEKQSPHSSEIIKKCQSLAPFGKDEKIIIAYVEVAIQILEISYPAERPSNSQNKVLINTVTGELAPLFSGTKIAKDPLKARSHLIKWLGKNFVGLAGSVVFKTSFGN
jgi:hypothetical protein